MQGANFDHFQGQIFRKSGSQVLSIDGSSSFVKFIKQQLWNQ